jgi:hypothetical protein
MLSVCVCVPDVPVCGMSGRERADIPQTGTSTPEDGHTVMTEIFRVLIMFLQNIF